MQNSTYTIKDFLEVKASGSPSFSPDGNLICFLSNESGTNQAYITSKHLCPKSDPGKLIKVTTQITNFSNSINHAVFSPTKNEIIVSKDNNGDEQMQLYMYDVETKDIRQLTNNTSVRHNFSRFSQDGNWIYYNSNERNGTDMDVYRMNLETNFIECIYQEGGSCNCVGVSKDDSTIVVRRDNSNVDKDLFLIDVQTKSAKHLTPHTGETYYGSAIWLPDHSGFYTIANFDVDFFGLALYDISSEKFIYLKNHTWDVDGFFVSKDSKYIALIINEDGYSRLSIFNSDDLNNPIETCIPETTNIGTLTFSDNSKYIALSINDSRHTTDVWLYSIEDDTLEQVTKSFQGVPSDVLVEPSLIHYKSFDGLEIPSFLYTPKEIGSNKKIPVIINIHGGPEAQSQPNLAPLTQYFVNQGYAVFCPNVRGSSGYGKKYLSLDDVEKRLDSLSDIVYLKKYIEVHQTDLDPSKIILFGGSYGGFMVLAGLAFYPELWAGGVDIVGIANFVTFLENTAGYRRAIREAEYGSLAKHRDILEKISPINHADKIIAPLYIIHGANDPRVPLSETEQMVTKIRENGGHVDFLVYEDEGHGLSKLKNRLDAYPKISEFISNIVA